jgi:hypothetical protein
MIRAAIDEFEDRTGVQDDDGALRDFEIVLEALSFRSLSQDYCAAVSCGNPRGISVDLSFGFRPRSNPSPAQPLGRADLQLYRLPVPSSSAATK